MQVLLYLGILSEVLPYLGISQDKIDVGTSNNSLVSVPNVKNKTVTEAARIIENAGFKCNYSLTGNKNSILVTDQVPAFRYKTSKEFFDYVIYF